MSFCLDHGGHYNYTVSLNILYAKVFNNERAYLLDKARGYSTNNITENYILKTNESYVYNSSKNLSLIKRTINNKYNIEFQDTNTPCAWVYVFGYPVEHGWGIKLFVNKIEVGTICTNQDSIFGNTKSELAFIKDKNGNDFIFF